MPTALALAIWVLNDWLLKYSFPSPVTGKVSDVAGLLVTPHVVMVVLLVLTAWMPGPMRHLVPPLSFGLVGFTFVAMKADPATGQAIRAALASLMGGGASGVTDPTDLAALPALGVAYVRWLRSRQTPAAPPRWRYLPILAMSAFATVATTPGVPPHVQLVGAPTDGATVVALYVDVDYYGGWYPRGIFATTDAGAHWRRVGDGVDFIAADPRVPGRYLAVHAGRLYVFELGGPVLTIPEHTDGDDLSRAQPQLVVPTWGREVYVLRHGVLHRTSGPGVSWEPLLDRVGTAAAARDEGVLYVITDGIVQRSTDGGTTWTRIGAFTERDAIIRVDPRAAEHLIASTRNGLFRSSRGGATWQRVWATTQAVSFRDFRPEVVFDPDHPERVYATVGVNVGLLVSGDGGKTWRESELSAVAVAVTRGSRQRVFIASDYRGVYHESSTWPTLEPWTRASTGLPYPSR